MKYAIYYRGMYWGPLHHEHMVTKIEDARQFTKEEALTFIKKVPGSVARLIKLTEEATKPQPIVVYLPTARMDIESIFAPSDDIHHPNYKG